MKFIMKKRSFLNPIFIILLTLVCRMDSSAQGMIDLWVGQYNDYFECQVTPHNEKNVIDYAGIYEMPESSGRFKSYNITFTPFGLMQASFTSKGIVGVIINDGDIENQACQKQGITSNAFECDDNKFIFVDIKFVNKDKKTVTAMGMIGENVYFYMKAGSEKVE